MKYTRLVNNFPGFLGERSGTLYDITEENYSGASYVPIFIENYHIKLDIDSFRRVIAMECTDKFASFQNANSWRIAIPFRSVNPPSETHNQKQNKNYQIQVLIN